ncbi:retrovirus-related pol polyprotein from transposon TNT 1-94 [Tanacetum coccineum]
MEAVVQQYHVDKQCFEIQKKQFLIENNRLLDQIISQDIVNIVMNSLVDVNVSVKVNSSVVMNDSVNYVEMCNKCLELEAELIKQHNMVKKDEYNRLSKRFNELEQHCISLEIAMQLNKENFQKNTTSMNQTEPLFDPLFELNNLKAELQAKDTTIKKLKAHIKRVNETSPSESLKKDFDEIETINIELEHKMLNAATISLGMYKLDLVILAPKVKNNREAHEYYLKHTMEQAAILREVVKIVLWYLESSCSMHMTEDRSELTNFVHKFLGTVKFGNDQVAKIMGYGDYQIVNVTVSRVYNVEELGHNLFSVGYFYDSDLEVAFRKHTCFMDMMTSSPICLLSKATKTKSWLWHRRLSHLNFSDINHLARHGLVRGLPKLKFEKDHLCSACSMGKSKKQSYKPKSKDTNQEKLYLLHMDLCRPMRVASVNGKRYILVIMDDYSRFTWVKFLASKDEALDFIIKFLKMIQVRLNATVRNIRTNNRTEFVNQTLRDYYEQVGISHETSVARTPQ